MTQLWNEIAESLYSREIFIPLLLKDEEEKSYGNNWAIGFLRGMDLRRSAWKELLDDGQNAGVLVPIFALAHELDPDPEMRPYKEPVDDELRDMLLAGTSIGVNAIYEFFAPHRQRGFAAMKNSLTVRRETKKPGRNDPCPCGSKKKYKKCCSRMNVN